VRHLAFLTLFLAARLAWAHGAVHEQIERFNARIAEQPGNADLYLQRGRLFLEDRHFEEAGRDFRRALQIDPHLRAAHYFHGDALLKSGDAASAERETRAFLAALGEEDRGGLSRGFRLLGQSLAAQGRPLESAGAFRTALHHAPDPDPAHYRDCAAAWLAAGPAYRETALEILDSGITRLGLLPALQEMALEIEIQAGRPEAAVKRLDGLIAQGQGRERWLFRKGEILLKAGRTPEARQAFEEALAAIEALPPGRRGTRALRELEGKVRGRLGGNDCPTPATNGHSRETDGVVYFRL
jgi:tetratricopeptide (TPR) repeat protein